MNPTPSAVIDDHQNSPTVIEALASCPDRWPTTSALAGDPPASQGAISCGFDNTRDYFPNERRRSATRPPADAPTMVQVVEQIAVDTTSDADWCSPTGIPRPIDLDEHFGPGCWSPPSPPRPLRLVR